MIIKNCRICDGKLTVVLSLGKIPIVNYFPSYEEIASNEEYPLDFCVCRDCGLAQLSYIISPQKIFKKYHYISGVSASLVRHLNNLADYCIRRFDIIADSKILDIGCNDGSMLFYFSQRGIFCVGVEPAVNIIPLISQKNIKVVNDFFNLEAAEKIDYFYGKFDLILATHTLANIVDLHEFTRGVKKLLRDGGVLVIEVGSLVQMIKKGQFDAIYHEHYSYFSFDTLKRLLKMYGLDIFQAEYNLCQGGSIRIFATQQHRISSPLQFGSEITSRDYEQFANKTLQFKEQIGEFFQSRQDGLVGFGAPAKGVTLLNYCNLGPREVKFIVDSTPFKQNRFMPGVNIPVHAEEYLENKNITGFLVLAWNYKKEILGKIKRYNKKSTEVIIPFPRLERLNLSAN